MARRYGPPAQIRDFRDTVFTFLRTISRSFGKRDACVSHQERYRDATTVVMTNLCWDMALNNRTIEALLRRACVLLECLHGLWLHKARGRRGKRAAKISTWGKERGKVINDAPEASAPAKRRGGNDALQARAPAYIYIYIYIYVASIRTAENTRKLR